MQSLRGGMSNRHANAQPPKEETSDCPLSGGVLVLRGLCGRVPSIWSHYSGSSDQPEHISELEAQRYRGIFQARDEERASSKYQAAVRRRMRRIRCS